MPSPREPGLGRLSVFHCDEGARLPSITPGTVQPDSDKREKSMWVAFDHLIDIRLSPVVARKTVSLEGFPSREKRKEREGFHLILTLCFAAQGDESHHSHFIRGKGEGWCVWEG